MRQDIRQLPLATSVKEDLQTVYEAIQELGYTEYTLLKLVERLNGHVEELRRITRDRPACPSGVSISDHVYATQEASTRTKDLKDDMSTLGKDVTELGRNVDEVQERINEISEQIDSVLKELKENLDIPDAAQRDLILKSAPLLIQASKQILTQTGYDPDTGHKVQTEIDADWKKFKGRLADFIWSMVFAGIGSLIVWSVGEHMKTQQEARFAKVEAAIQTLVDLQNKVINTYMTPKKPAP